MNINTKIHWNADNAVLVETQDFASPINEYNYILARCYSVVLILLRTTRECTVEPCFNPFTEVNGNELF